MKVWRCFWNRPAALGSLDEIRSFALNNVSEPRAIPWGPGWNKKATKGQILSWFLLDVEQPFLLLLHMSLPDLGDLVYAGLTHQCLTPPPNSLGLWPQTGSYSIVRGFLHSPVFWWCIVSILSLYLCEPFLYKHQNYNMIYYIKIFFSIKVYTYMEAWCIGDLF